MNSLKIIAVAAMTVGAACAQAGTITSAVSGTILTGGPGFGTLTETINQAGLSANYVSGVTDFGTFTTSGVTHTLVFSGFEWFSNSGTTAASVVYDLGSAKNLSGMALWNEESSGIGFLTVSGSTDGVNFTTLLNNVTPIDNPLAAYPVEVFNWTAGSAQYIKFDMSGCPQALPGSFPACAIGEVAFNQVAIPEPETYALMGLGLGLVGWMARRRRV